MGERCCTLLVVLIGAVLRCVAQPPNDDCADAIILCALQPLTGDNTGAVGALPGFCPGTGSVLWYTFHTNSVGGPVTVSLGGIDCPGLAGMDNELSVVVLSGDGSCTPGSFSAVSTCEQDSVDLSVTTVALLPDTTYWVLVSGVADNGATIDAQCGFTLMAGGPGIDVVNVDLDAGPDVQIGQGANTQLQATGGTDYTWSPTSGLSGNTVPNPIAQPNETTTYTVTTHIDGCTYSDQVTVEIVRLIDPPNTITPNGDGHNDVWEIPNIADHTQADVSIYDRWGQRVFHSVGYREPFDGKGLPTATYYWTIDLNDLNGRADPYTGYLTIVR